MPSIYDDIKKLYNLLNEGDVNQAREVVSGLVSRGVDKDFMATVFEMFAKEKMALFLYDEVVKERKKSKTE